MRTFEDTLKWHLLERKTLKLRKILWNQNFKTSSFAWKWKRWKCPRWWRWNPFRQPPDYVKWMKCQNGGDPRVLKFWKRNWRRRSGVPPCGSVSDGGQASVCPSNLSHVSPIRNMRRTVYRTKTNDEPDLPRKLGFHPPVYFWDEEYNGQGQMTSDQWPDLSLKLGSVRPSAMGRGFQQANTNYEPDLSRKLGFRSSVCLWDQQYKWHRQITSQPYHGS